MRSKLKTGAVKHESFDDTFRSVSVLTVFDELCVKNFDDLHAFQIRRSPGIFGNA